MAPVSTKRSRIDDDARRQPKKKIKVRRQIEYHSSSEEETGDEGQAHDAPKTAESVRRAQSTPAKPKSILKRVAPASTSEPQPAEETSDDDKSDDGEDETAKNTARNIAQGLESDAEEDEDEDDLADVLGDEPDISSDEEADIDAESETSTTSCHADRGKKKRNNPDAFATSISKILGSKLTSAKRSDPVLARSKSAADANKTLADQKLEQRARAQIRAEKKAALEKGRMRDVLGLETEAAQTGKIMEEEKRLKKTAQRGVVKLFNAVRAAQVKAEEAMKQARAEGTVGMAQREEKVQEMSKQGFLDLISSGGKTKEL